MVLVFISPSIGAAATKVDGILKSHGRAAHAALPMVLNATLKGHIVNSPASPSFTLSGLHSAGEIQDVEKHQSMHIFTKSG